MIIVNVYTQPGPKPGPQSPTYSGISIVFNIVLPIAVLGFFADDALLEIALHDLRQKKRIECHVSLAIAFTPHHSITSQ
jgi:hypothetical protein